MIKHEKLNILLRKCIASTFSRAVVTGRYISAWPIRCKHVEVKKRENLEWRDLSDLLV
jgi:hypothetical protein